MAVWKVVESIGKYLLANCASVAQGDRSDLKLENMLGRLFPGEEDIALGWTERWLQPMLYQFFRGSDRSSAEKAVISFVRLHQARNAFVHEGAVSRTLSAHAVRLSLAIEEALMTELKDGSIESWMVPDPVVAHPWQSVSKIREALLSGGYSALPIWHDGVWHFVRDVAVVDYLRRNRHNRGSENCAVVDSCKEPVLDLCPVRMVIKVKVRDGRISVDSDKSDFSLESVYKGDHVDGLPALVVDTECCSRLLGVLTPHDLLV